MSEGNNTIILLNTGNCLPVNRVQQAKTLESFSGAFSFEELWRLRPVNTKCDCAALKVSVALDYDLKMQKKTDLPRYSPEPFLSRCVPNLQLDFLS